MAGRFGGGVGEYAVLVDGDGATLGARGNCVGRRVAVGVGDRDGAGDGAGFGVGFSDGGAGGGCGVGRIDGHADGLGGGSAVAVVDGDVEGVGEVVGGGVVGGRCVAGRFSWDVGEYAVLVDGDGATLGAGHRRRECRRVSIGIGDRDRAGDLPGNRVGTADGADPGRQRSVDWVEGDHDQHFRGATMTVSCGQKESVRAVGGGRIVGGRRMPSLFRGRIGELAGQRINGDRAALGAGGWSTEARSVAIGVRSRDGAGDHAVLITGADRDRRDRVGVDRHQGHRHRHDGGSAVAVVDRDGEGVDQVVGGGAVSCRGVPCVVRWGVAELPGGRVEDDRAAFRGAGGGGDDCAVTVGIGDGDGSGDRTGLVPAGGLDCGDRCGVGRVDGDGDRHGGDPAVAVGGDDGEGVGELVGGGAVRGGCVAGISRRGVGEPAVLVDGDGSAPAARRVNHVGQRHGAGVVQAGRARHHAGVGISAVHGVSVADRLRADRFDADRDSDATGPQESQPAEDAAVMRGGADGVVDDHGEPVGAAAGCRGGVGHVDEVAVGVDSDAAVRRCSADGVGQGEVVVVDGVQRPRDGAVGALPHGGRVGGRTLIVVVVGEFTDESPQRFESGRDRSLRQRQAIRNRTEAHPVKNVGHDALQGYHVGLATLGGKCGIGQ